MENYTRATEVVLDQMTQSALSECAGYDAMDREKLLESEKAKDAETVSMRGWFYVTRKPGDPYGETLSPTEGFGETLYGSANNMTLFRSRWKAKKAIWRSKLHTKMHGHIYSPYHIVEVGDKPDWLKCKNGNLYYLPHAAKVRFDKEE